MDSHEHDFSSLVSWPHHWQPETVEPTTQVVPERHESMRQRAQSLQIENDHSCPDGQLSSKDQEEEFNLTTSTSTMSITNNHLIKTTPTMRTTTATSHDQSKYLTRKHPSIKKKSAPFDEHRSAPMLGKSVLEHLVFVFPENVRRLLAGSKK